MEPEQRTEFDRLRTSVVEGFRNGLFLGDAGLRIVQFLVLPSFDDFVCWELRSRPRRKAATETRLNQIRWAFGADCDAFRSPAERLKHPRPFRPSVATRSALVAMSTFEVAVDRLASVAIRLMPKSAPSGLDGTGYELALGDYFCNSRVAWWVRLPAEWKDLDPPLTEFLSLCESVALAEPTDPR